MAISTAVKSIQAIMRQDARVDSDAQGICVIRFSNQAVKQKIDSVLQAIFS